MVESGRTTGIWILGEVIDESHALTDSLRGIRQNSMSDPVKPGSRSGSSGKDGVSRGTLDRSVGQRVELERDGELLGQIAGR